MAVFTRLGNTLSTAMPWITQALKRALADFNDTRFEYAGISSRFSQRNWAEPLCSNT